MILGLSSANGGYDGWTVKTVVTRRSSASMIPAPDFIQTNGGGAVSKAGLVGA